MIDCWKNNDVHKSGNSETTVQFIIDLNTAALKSVKLRSNYSSVRTLGSSKLRGLQLSAIAQPLDDSCVSLDDARWFARAIQSRVFRAHSLHGIVAVISNEVRIGNADLGESEAVTRFGILVLLHVDFGAAAVGVDVSAKFRVVRRRFLNVVLLVAGAAFGFCFWLGRLSERRQDDGLVGLVVEAKLIEELVELRAGDSVGRFVVCGGWGRVGGRLVHEGESLAVPTVVSEERKQIILTVIVM